MGSTLVDTAKISGTFNSVNMLLMIDSLSEFENFGDRFAIKHQKYLLLEWEQNCIHCGFKY